MPRRKKEEDNRSTLQRQKEFLEAYADSFSIQRAADLSRVDRSAHYRWFRESARYARLFEAVKQNAANYLETEAITRAGEGWLEPVYYQGAVCGETRRHDSGLIQFLLRGMMPEKYGARTEISGPAGEPVQARIEVVFVKPGDTSSGGQ